MIKTDTCVVRVCRECILLLIVCTCLSEHVEWIGFNVVKLPYKTVKYAIASINTLDINTTFTLSETSS